MAGSSNSLAKAYEDRGGEEQRLHRLREARPLGEERRERRARHDRQDDWRRQHEDDEHERLRDVKGPVCVDEPARDAATQRAEVVQHARVRLRDGGGRERAAAPRHRSGRLRGLRLQAAACAPTVLAAEGKTEGT